MVPVCSHAGVEVDEIAINLVVIKTDKARLRGKGADRAGAGNRFIKVNVDWRTRL